MLLLLLYSNRECEGLQIFFRSFSDLFIMLDVFSPTFMSLARLLLLKHHSFYPKYIIVVTVCKL